MLTPETLAELRRLLDECQPGRVIVNDLRPTHNAIWLDSRYDSDDGWKMLRTLAEIDAETETVEVLWGLDDAVLIAAAVNALPALLDAADERDALAARLEGAEAVIEVQDVHARLVIAERDEAMRALGKLTAERDAEPDRIAELTAERDALAAERDAMLAIIDDARHALSADGPKVEPARQVLARALPQITAWQDRTRHARDNTPPHVIAHRGAQLDVVTAERDALAAKLDVVREWIHRRGVDVGDRDDDYMDGYRAAQRHALHDAATLLAAIDGDANDEPEPNPDDCPVCDVPRHFTPSPYHPATPCPHWNARRNA